MTVIPDTRRQAVRNLNKLRVSKIQSNQRLLQNLVAKRLRLDVEIQNLTRALRKQTRPQKVTVRSLKESGLDESQLTEANNEWNEDPYVADLIRGVLIQLNEVSELLAVSGNQFRIID